MRLIDADALLKDMMQGSPTQFGRATAKMCVKRAPTISPAANWTPCSVGLPEDQKDVLIYFDRCGGEIGIGYYGERSDGKRFWCVMGSMLCYNVLAWQPLPEPYRGEE